MHRLRAATVLLGLSLALGLLPFAAPPVRAETVFVVTSATDQPDLDLGDGRCDALLDAGDQCTLRAAILQANQTAGADVINFNIPGPGVKTIRPATELPA